MNQNTDLAKFAFLEQINAFDGDSPSGAQPGVERKRDAAFNNNTYVKLQKDMAMQAAMNIDMPMAKGIITDAFMEKNNLVTKRKGVNPLGNFWNQNLDQIFKDF